MALDDEWENVSREELEEIGGIREIEDPYIRTLTMRGFAEKRGIFFTVERGAGWRDKPSGRAIRRKKRD